MFCHNTPMFPFLAIFLYRQFYVFTVFWSQKALKVKKLPNFKFFWNFWKVWSVNPYLSPKYWFYGAETHTWPPRSKNAPLTNRLKKKNCYIFTPSHAVLSYVNPEIISQKFSPAEQLLKKSRYSAPFSIQTRGNF